MTGFRRDDPAVAPVTVIASAGPRTLIRLPGGDTAWIATRYLLPRCDVTIRGATEEVTPT